MPLLLAIESSCDDTSVSLWKDGKVLSNIAASQNVHAQYGGVIPELASRAHLQNIIPVLDIAIKNAGYSIQQIDAIAATIGPGLIGSLMVGINLAKSLSLALDRPFIAVHHMQAHILSPLLGEAKPEYPYLCLVVSGGHTQIVRVNSPFDILIMGQTKDDAAGEAFDKCAKMLDLPYPGGPLLDKLAKSGNPEFYKFPRPNLEGFDFSFSGLKTSFLYFLQNKIKEDSAFIENNKADLAASIQHTIVTILINTLEKVQRQTQIKDIAIAGGVSANSYLRKMIKEWAQAKYCRLFIPDLEYCTDNAAMIAQVASYYFDEGIFNTLDVSPLPKS